MNQNQQTVIRAIQEDGHNPNAIGHIEFDRETGHFKFNRDASPATITPQTGSSQVILKNEKDGWAAEAAPYPIPSSEQFYDPIDGVFESDLLRDKVGLFIGLGSVGSQVCLNLAREGLGHFILVDHDRVEPHNLSRHIAGVKDIGRLKTDVMEDAILQKNPYADITKMPTSVLQDSEALSMAFRKANIVFCMTDNNPSRYVVVKSAVEAGKTVIYGRANTRAEGVDVFIQRPGQACYNCLVDAGGMIEEEITNAASSFENGTIPAYTSPEDANVMVQIGLPSDIDPLVTMIVKLGLLELTGESEDSGISSLYNELHEFNFFIWANRRTNRYLCFSPFNHRRDMPTILSWYGCTIPNHPNCSFCKE